MMYFFLGLIILGLIFLCINIYELTHFELNEYLIDAGEKINGDFEFLILSDLHNNTYGKENCKLIKCINDTKVEKIIVAGDMVTGKIKSDWSKTERFLLKLAENHTIYYVNGNHEYRTKVYIEKFGDKYREYKDRLKNAGIIFLENEYTVIDNIRITGLEIDRKYYKKFKRYKINIEEIVQSIGKVDDNYYNILVAHNPRYISEYVKWKPDIIISGHFHGGVMRIGKRTGVISPQFDVFPKFSGGLYKMNKITAIVSRGLGTHSVNIRLFNKPEVIKIKLQKH
ncbi:MAG: metallophosphoesterase [Lachnospiraceae bacterium]|nr:metallophosphoesterase [Lachnospiraceae bacterium]